MKLIKQEETERFQNGETCRVSEYPLSEESIDAAVARIDGRYPDEGWALNRVSKEVAFVIRGQGKLVCEESEEMLAAGDVVLIDSGEKFYWEGEMEIFITCAPAWKYAQYEHVID